MPSSDGQEIARCGIAVMAKASQAGRTKTRLSPPLTGDEAAQMNSAFLTDIAANLIAAGHDASIAGYFATAPQGEEAFFSFLPRAIGRFDACGAHFGICLDLTIETLFARGHRSAGVLNADSPTLPTAMLVEAATHLDSDDDRVVLGPSDDGGYYFLGMTRHHRRLFEDIDWSTERVLAQTLARAADIGVPVHMLPIWYDVDEAAALRRLWGELLGDDATRLPPSRGVATRDLLLALDDKADLFQRLGLPSARVTAA